MQIDFFRFTRPCIKVKRETAVRRQHLADCVLQRSWVKCGWYGVKIMLHHLLCSRWFYFSISFLCCVITSLWRNRNQQRRM